VTQLIQSEKQMEAEWNKRVAEIEKDVIDKRSNIQGVID
jgi:hypothetical protein